MNAMTKVKTYKKRSGTSGISGHLYETKLIALVLFRLLHDECVEHFCLVSNMDEIGAFDDICFKIKMKGRDRTFAVFIQVKHKENDDKYPTFDNKNESVKWFESLSKIKKKITSKEHDEFFSGDIVESDCVFVLYTNAKCDFDSKSAYVSDYDSIVNSLIGTSSTVGTLPLYTEQHVEAFGLLILKEDLTLLVQHFANFLTENRSMNIMNDEYVLQYHVLLKENVVDVTDLPHEHQKSDEKGRYLTFRDDFFVNEHKYVTLFRDKLFKEILMNHPKLRHNSLRGNRSSQDDPMPQSSVNDLVSTFLAKPSVNTLTPLVITHLAYNDSFKLEFLLKRPLNDIEKLRQINISRAIIDEAYLSARTAVVNFLRSLKLKVPMTFGNVDLAINGTSKRVERRLNCLKTAVVNLCKSNIERGQNRIVTIDDNIDSAILGLNGGLASAVGNLLTYDGTTNMLMFCNDFTFEQNNAKSLFEKLVTEIDDLDRYRFDIKTIKFPKLNFDCTNEARGFLGKLVIFAKQKGHSEVEEIVKKDLKNRLCTNTHTFSINADLVFLHYHNEIQKWWMSPKMGTYLTKIDNLHEQAIHNIVTEPQISALQIMFYVSNVRYFTYSFEENATEWIKVPEALSKLFVVTDTVTLTTVKVVQCLRGRGLIKNYSVLDLNCIFDMPTADFSSLVAELRETENVIIIVWHNKKRNNVPHFKLYELAQAAKHKPLIVIINSKNECMEMLNECFDTEIISDATQNLTALTLESQREVLKNAIILFQGKEIGLDLLLDEASVPFIKGDILDKVIRNEPIRLGSALSNTNYEEIKHLYIDRRLGHVGEGLHSTFVVRTLYDVADDAVLVTATPGMGKSTLLTHLSIKTKERARHVWIVRINLLNHSKQFYDWHVANINVDLTEALTFLCRAVSNASDVSICFVNNKVRLQSCEGDYATRFEVDMFLHFYNEGNLIFLFDGFDEICPHYKDVVINFLNVVRSCPRTNRMWVTSRPCTGVYLLEKLVGKCFYLDHLSLIEQKTYLENIWQEKITNQKLDNMQHNNLQNFLNDISRTMSTGFFLNDALHTWMRKIFIHFYEFVRSSNSYVSLSFDTFKVPEEVDSVIPDVETLSGTPLLLYFVADYTVNVINNYKRPDNRQLYSNLVSLYESFVENKLKKILFQDKNKMDIYNPDIITRYEKEMTECISLHKRVAAHVVLNLQPAFTKIDVEEFKGFSPFAGERLADFNDLVNRIKEGTEKHGLISHVTLEDVPVFIHKTFLEYFAAEYICDILKCDNFMFDEKKKWLYAVSECCDEDVFIWVRFRAKLDQELTATIRNIGITESFILSLI